MTTAVLLWAIPFLCLLIFKWILAQHATFFCCHFNENVSQKTYLETSQTTKTQLFGNNIHSFQLLIIFRKSSILDVWLGCEYASGSGCKILKIQIYFELECLRMSSALSQVQKHTFERYNFTNDEDNTQKKLISSLEKDLSKIFQCI